MEFIFKPGKIGLGFTEEISMILAKRTEIASRQKMPALWNKIDRMNKNKASKEVLRRRKIRYVFYGIILITVGFFLLIPGLMKPDELFVPLVVGAFSIINGIFAVMPRKSAAERFEKNAKKLIKSLDSSINNGDNVIFSEENITENGTVLMEYCEITEIYETKNFFFVSNGTKAAVLRKCDLVSGNDEDLKLFLENKTEKTVFFCE